MKTDVNQFKLDQIDCKIISHIMKANRISFAEIAKDVNSSVDVVNSKYNKLLTNGLFNVKGVKKSVKKFSANARVNLKVSSSRHLDNITSELSKINEICFIGITSGSYAVEISLECFNNLHLMEVLNDHIYTIEGVSSAKITMYFDVQHWKKRISFEERKRLTKIEKLETSFPNNLPKKSQLLKSAM